MSSSIVQFLYVATFSGATIACLAAACRVRTRFIGDVRRGLASLFASSGLWAGLTVAQLVAPTVTAKAWLFTAGLVVGFATVGCWLYFVSAYTGSGFHRDPSLRAVAIGGFLLVAGVKLTNEVHGGYFSYALATEPFVHLALVRHWPHWLVTAVAYALVVWGFVVLFRTYGRSGHDSGRIALLAGVAGVPVVPDLIATLRPDLLLTVTYEPIGVAAFALGSLFVVETDREQLRVPARAQVVDDLDDPVVVLDDADVVADFNPAAAVLFASADTPLSVGDPAPSVVVGSDGDTESPITIAPDGRERHFLLRTSAVELGPHEVGRVRVFTDVTRLVTQRRDLRRQHLEMDNIAEAIAHELRNDLNIAAGYAGVLADRLEDGDATMGRAVGAIATAHDRMDDVIGDLATLAELAQSTDGVEPHAIETVVRRAREATTVSDLRVSVEGTSGTVVAEERRLTALLSNLFEHATERDATVAAVSLAEDGFVVRHDGRPIPDDRTDSAFQYGTAVTDGIGLANAGSLARVHGWSLSIELTPDSETEILARGVETTLDPTADPVT
jgi:signal transduction histidine kinase